MSTTTRPDTPASVVLASTAEDAAAVEAVREHHAELAGRLAAHAEHLLRMVAAADSAAFGQARAAAADFCTEQLLPHAAAEEDALYPAAGALPQTKLLVEAMIAEHRVLEGLVRDLGEATEPPRVAAAAHALRVLFDAHLAKENDVILPAVAADPAVSLTGILAGMHELLGEQGGHEHGGHEHGGHEERQPGSAAASTQRPRGGPRGGPAQRATRRPTPAAAAATQQPTRRATPAAAAARLRGPPAAAATRSTWTCPSWTSARCRTRSGMPPSSAPSTRSRQAARSCSSPRTTRSRCSASSPGARAARWRSRTSSEARRPGACA